jgi:diketogulonate reductase-like aldo/keto reductase
MTLLSVVVVVLSLCVMRAMSVWVPGIRIQSSTGIGAGEFNLMDQVQNQRPVYYSKESGMYVFHLNVNSIGRWLISANLGANDGIAYVDSWAVTPCMIQHASPLARWRVSMHATWMPDASMSITSVNGFDRTVYLQSVRVPHIGGFFVETGKRADGRMLHQRVGNGADPQLFLYYLDSAHRWIVGDTPGSSAGLAYADSTADSAYGVFASSAAWFVVDSNQNWVADESFQFLSGSEAAPIFDMLRLNANTASQRGRASTVPLHDGGAMPVVGLGTGGTMPRDDVAASIERAVSHGWTLIDTAESYENEQAIGSLISQRKVHRRSLFITTKVWVTHLGFEQTLRAVHDSLVRLRTGYLNLVLIHWPRCSPHLGVDCSAIQGGGTWEQSYSALERLYAEGVALAIGVSNFNTADLEELFARNSAVLPHVVQNFMDVANHDFAVLDRLKEKKIAYQAYSPLRGLAPMLKRESEPPQYRMPFVALTEVARKVGRTTSAVALRWLIEQSAAVLVSARTTEQQYDAMSALDFDLEHEDLVRIGAAGRRLGEQMLARHVLRDEDERIAAQSARNNNNAINAGVQHGADQGPPQVPGQFFAAANQSASSSWSILGLCVVIVVVAAVGWRLWEGRNRKRRQHFE